MDFLGGFLARMVIYAIGFAVLWWLAKKYRDYKNKKDIASLPDPGERMILIKEIRKQRANGKTHQQCMEYLLGQGLRKGVAEGFLIDVETEQSPDLHDTNLMEWRDWTCEYPGNWKEVIDEGFSREISVTLEGLGGSGITFYCIPEMVLKDLLREQRLLLKDIRSSPVYQWGTFPGRGERLTGIQKMYKVQMEMMVFQCDGSEKLTVLEIKMLEEPEVNDAFDLIESSFKYTPKNENHGKM